MKRASLVVLLVLLAEGRSLAGSTTVLNDWGFNVNGDAASALNPPYTAPYINNGTGAPPNDSTFNGSLFDFTTVYDPTT